MPVEFNYSFTDLLNTRRKLPIIVYKILPYYFLVSFSVFKIFLFKKGADFGSFLNFDLKLFGADNSFFTLIVHLKTTRGIK